MMMLWYLLLTTVCAAVLSHQHRKDAHSQETVPEEKVLLERVVVNVPTPVPIVNPSDVAKFLSASTVAVITEAVETGTAQILPSLPNIISDTTGTVQTALETAGHNTLGPLLTNFIPSPTSLISVPTGPAAAANEMAIVPLPKVNATASSLASNIFSAPIGGGGPLPPTIGKRTDHPVPRLGVVSQTAPVSTNKFYANFLLGDQKSATWLHPYSVAWSAGGGESGSWGLAVSHIEASQRYFGPTNFAGDNQYFINPIGIQSMILSAAELGSSTALTATKLTDMSAVVQLRASPASTPLIQFPLTQGAGFVTALYTASTPEIQSGVFFNTVVKVTAQPRAGVQKYRIQLNDGHTWLLYALRTAGYAFDLQVINNGLIRATYPFTGILQMAKLDVSGAGEALYDAACGQYATGVTLSATAQGMRGTYTFAFQKTGLSGAPLVMFALPHHLDSFDSATAAGLHSQVQLQTTTKGLGTAVVADAWTMVEQRLPVSMAFVPWSSTKGSMYTLTAAAKTIVRNMALREISQDMGAQSNLNSMYYSGKALAKFAMVLAVCNDMLGDTALVAQGLVKLKAAFALFASNQQQYPLVYESAWGGVVSTASYTTGDSGVDFGNTYYNDHHFHYGYHVLAASVIGHIDTTWMAANKAYVNTLVRDYANPTAADTLFPANRNFDWFHGHSWAHGLYETADGKDQESSSEDMMSSYAIKMWGMVSGDANMAARGNLQLAILARSLNLYYLYTSTNTVQPPNFIGNKVAGILFENKIDHTTYFGANIEYIQGIHMIPLLACSQLIRQQQFVTEEWDRFFSNGRADQVVGGWRGILYGNLATIQPTTAFTFFNQPNFDSSWLDGGASLTWYLAYSAALGSL